ncbi:hypothetical protein CHLNCDRAFT_137182 [Chlorella variabilis]|uniref:Alpha-galactosidase n=1 Tax=Chlorella variabilis TaxID=554065 RepID=E1ZLF5_CHLVA|nr:hypothetical protein CHLNCDRAFT_137182 [Chlorella variabilis]EFN53392.1 hypothetical protein CHLNCDRAFT_137182 [Chlorella variabilis]|eukprot:XP_005845494.1 hypothetical protein CHLNCDRAFT_137182 [Chlorella variabilis]
MAPGFLGCLLLLAAACRCPAVAALRDGQATTPPMGFNTWNAFGARINEDLIRDAADRIVELGLRDAGYTFLVLDDGWSDVERTGDGRLQGDRERFSSGAPLLLLLLRIKALADYVRGKGLRLGIYSDSGHFTCQGFPGSRDHEREDAQSFADWGVDYLKYDNCFVHDDLLGRFVAMRDALNATGRPFVYSLSEWGIGDPWVWGPQVAHAWRTTFDSHPSWPSIMLNLDESVALARYAGPGAWNDLDLLEVGPTGSPNARSYLSHQEEQAHFALWALLKSPLFVAANLRQLSPVTLAILKTHEVIAVNQDELGVPGDLVYAAPLADGGRAVVLLNRHSQYQASNLTLRWQLVGYPPDTRVVARDLFQERDIGQYAGSLTAEVHVHGVVALRLTPVAPDPSHSQWRPWHGVPMFERHQEDEEWIPPLGSEGREVQAGS